jgi:hypothetical protein
MIYNKKPDIISKMPKDTGGEKDKEKSTPIFMYDEIKQINNAWQECPFNQKQLD